MAKIYSIVLHRSDACFFDRDNEAFNLPTCRPGSVPWVLCRRICGRFFPDVLNVPHHGRVIVEIFDEPVFDSEVEGGRSVELRPAAYGFLYVNKKEHQVFSNASVILDPLFDGRDRLFGIVRPFSDED
jgi:hypothetical protein